MATPPISGESVTPGEFPSAYLRWLSQNVPGSGASWQQAEPTLQDQIAGPFGQAAAAGPTPFEMPQFAQEAMAANAELPTIAEKAYTGGRFGGLGEIAGGLAARGNGYGLGSAAYDLAQSPGAYMIAGQLLANPAGRFVGNATGSKGAGNITEQALRGGSFGAGLGMLGGPFSEITAPVGAGIGAFSNVVANAIYNALPGSLHRQKVVTAEPQVYTQFDQNGNPIAGSQANWDDVISGDQSLLNSLNLDSVQKGLHGQVADQYNKMKNAGNLDQAHQYLLEVANAHAPSLPGLPDAGVTNGGLSAGQLLQYQQMASQLMAPYIEQQRKAANAQAAQLGAAFFSNDPNVQKINQTLTNVEQQGNNALAGAYMTQAMGLPFLDATAANAYNEGLTYEQKLGQASRAVGGGTSGSLASQLALAAPATGSNAAQVQVGGAQSTINPTQYNPAAYLTTG